MKRIITASIALVFLSCGFATAQKKGEISIGGMIGVSGGYSKTSPVITVTGKGTGTASSGKDLTPAGDYTVNVDTKSNEKTPSSTMVSAGAEFGWFFADNWKLGVNIQYALDSNPYEKNNGKWLRQNTNLVFAGPQLAYYLKISDGFYYTPQIAAYGLLGTAKTEAQRISEIKDVFGYGFELAPGAFEFRPTSHFAFSVSFLSLGYTHTKMKANGQYDHDIKTDTITYDLAIQPSIGLRYYF